MDEFIQNLMGLVQLNIQKRAQEQSEARQRGDMVAVFSNLSQQTTNPELAAALRKSFAPLTGRTEDELLSLQELTVPTLPVRQSAAIGSGLASMEPADVTAVNQAAATMGLTSQSPFQLAMGQAYMGLPMNERVQGAGIGIGTRMGAVDLDRSLHNLQLLNEQIRSNEQTNQLGWANNRLGWASLASQDAFRQLGLQLDQAKANQAEGFTIPQVIDLISTYGTQLIEFQREKKGMSKNELQARLNLLRGLEQQLISVGVIPGQPVSGNQTGVGPNNQFPVGPTTPGDVSIPWWQRYNF